MLTKTEQELITNIDTEEVVSFLQKLVQTNSENPPGNEEACALLIEQELQSFGCVTELQYVEENRPNIIGTMEGELPEKLLFNGHLDTVQLGEIGNWTCDPLGGEIIDGKVFGRGACDMKAGLVSMIFAMKALKKMDVSLKRGILFTGVIDEEVYFKGTNALVESGLVKDCRFGFVSEPTSLEIVTEHKGAIEYRCEVEGKSAHSGKAHQGVNAIVRMAKVIDALETYNCNLAEYEPHSTFITPTLNIGTIRGGVGVTFVPEYCQIEFDRQVLPGESLEEVAKEVDAIFAGIPNEYNFTPKLITTQSFAPWQVEKTDAYVVKFADIVASFLESEPTFSGLHGYCEAEILGRAGISCLVFGPGCIDCAHAPDEYVAIDELIAATKVYAVAAYRFAMAES